MDLAASRSALGRVLPGALGPGAGARREARAAAAASRGGSPPLRRPRPSPSRALRSPPGCDRPRRSPGRAPLAARAGVSEGEWEDVDEVPTAPLPAFDASDPDAEVPLEYLLATAKEAALAGARAVRSAADSPRRVRTKSGFSDLVTDTDALSERLVIEAIGKRLPQHHVLGEEGGVVRAGAGVGADEGAAGGAGGASSDAAPRGLGRYLWCVDPLDGTTNFAHGYPSFAVSVAVLDRGFPAAACVVEFHGGPGAWAERTYEASLGGGAFCDGRRVSVSPTAAVRDALLVTGFGYLHDAAWAANLGHFATLTARSRGVRREGAAAVDLAHVALGVADAFWEPRLKPWDVAAGMLIVKEAGGVVTSMEELRREGGAGGGAGSGEAEQGSGGAGSGEAGQGSGGAGSGEAEQGSGGGVAPLSIPAPFHGAFEPTLLVASTPELCAELLGVIGPTTTALIDKGEVEGLRGAHYVPDGYAIEQGVW